MTDKTIYALASLFLLCCLFQFYGILKGAISRFLNNVVTLEPQIINYEY